MQLRTLFGGAALAGALTMALPAPAYDVTTFDPDAFFTAGSGPLPAEVDALDAAADISSFDIESFEDLTLEPGLTIERSGELPTSVLSFGSLVNQPEATWDVTFSLEALIDLVPNQPLVIRYPSGLQAISLGVSGFDHSHELLVNGENLGAVNSFPNFRTSPVDNRRNLYIRVDREPGDPPITEVSFIPDPNLPNPNGDNVRIDHLALGSLPKVPALSAPFLLLLAGSLGAWGVSRLHGTKTKRACGPTRRCS